MTSSFNITLYSVDLRVEDVIFLAFLCVYHTNVLVKRKDTIKIIIKRKN